VIFLFLLLSCGDKDEDDSATTAEVSWYLTCGDPVCSGYSGPFDGVPACTSETIGDACGTEASTCDPVDDCNALMLCTDSDPQQEPGGCPISSASFKREIAYLTPAQVDALARQVVAMPLAEWSYTAEDPTARRVGFIIEDVPGSSAIRPDGQGVDLYGYTSLTVAAVQQQQRELETLRAELAVLRAELEALKAAR
jgi:hypothetical protein